MTILDWFETAYRLAFVIVGVVSLLRFWTLCGQVNRIEEKLFQKPKPPDDFNRQWWLSKPTKLPKFTKHFP